MRKSRYTMFILLWVLSIILVLFSIINSVGLIIRPYAFICLVIAVTVSLFKKYRDSPYWLTTCIVGVVVGLASTVPLITTRAYNDTIQISDTKPHQIGNWYLKMNPKKNDPHSTDFVDYSFQFVYLGDIKTNYKIQVGNVIVGDDKVGIVFGEGGTVGSSFPKGVKQIELLFSAMKENGQSFKQMILFKVDK